MPAALNTSSRLRAWFRSASPESSRKGRIVTRYADNHTASLALPDPVQSQRRLSRARLFIVPAVNRMTMAVVRLLPVGLQKKLHYVFYIEQADPAVKFEIERLQNKINRCKKPTKIDALTKQKVELLANNIEEHAYRRVELFFYLLIAVWNKRITISKEGGADYQHGMGSSIYGTQACHSCPFTNLKFSGKPDLHGTHFYDSLNSTMELPDVVNQFDRHYEGAYGMSNQIKTGIEILNKCAAGEINPIEGLQRYLETLDHFFKKFEEKYINQQQTIELPDSMAQVWALQQKGTFSLCVPGTIQPGTEFLTMTLGISLFRVQIGMVNGAFKKIQNEIYTTTPSVTNEPSSIRNVR